MTIKGSDLTGATSVTFGRKASPRFRVVSDTEITATSPGGLNGRTVPVTVTTPVGTSELTGAVTYTYLRPVVSGLSPPSGPAAGANTVTITGSNLTGATSVTFGRKSSPRFSIVSDTEITATSPGGISGDTVSVKVTTADGSVQTERRKRLHLRELTASAGSYDLPSLPLKTTVPGGSATIPTNLPRDFTPNILKRPMTRFVESTITFPYKRSLGPVVGAFMTALTEKRILGIR